MRKIFFLMIVLIVTDSISGSMIRAWGAEPDLRIGILVGPNNSAIFQSRKTSVNNLLKANLGNYYGRRVILDWIEIQDHPILKQFDERGSSVAISFLTEYKLDYVFYGKAHRLGKDLLFEMWSKQGETKNISMPYNPSLEDRLDDLVAHFLLALLENIGSELFHTKTY